MPPKKVYWDTSCFISFLSDATEEESNRNDICQDVMKHARDKNIEIWTSVWTIVETIRPKSKYQPLPLPQWADSLDATDANGNLLYPKGKDHLQLIWNYYNRHTAPARKLSEVEAKKIKGMFAWPWIQKIQIVPTIAEHAAEIARSYNLKPADSLHVASALARGCDSIQRWDRDYRKTDALIFSADPTMISPPNLLTGLPLPSSEW